MTELVAAVISANFVRNYAYRYIPFYLPLVEARTAARGRHQHSTRKQESPKVQDILERFEFRDQVPRLAKADALGAEPDMLRGTFVVKIDGSPAVVEYEPESNLREPEAEYVTKPRIYVDTSVFGGCEDEEFREESLQFFEAFRCGAATLVFSEVTERELKKAPPSVREIIKQIPKAHFETLPESEQALSLAKAYIEAEALGPAHFADALHVAIASIGEVDVIASWNFKHMVRSGRVQAYNRVNERHGHPNIDIQFPEDISHG